MNILGTGLSGLVGSKLVQTYEDSHSFENLDLSDPSNPVDITNPDQVKKALSASDAPFVVHFAAFTDVTKAWEQKDDKDGIVYKVNVEGTKNIIKACEETEKHLIHISTAYVFDGNKTETYTEADSMSPIEWYGQTKAWAEEAVCSSSCGWTILRIDQPFRSDPFPKLDIAHRIIKGLQEGTLPPLFTDHYFGPTYIDDFVKVIDWVLRTKTTGLFNASSGEMWNDFEFGKTIQEKLNLSGEVRPGYLDSYLATLQRPYQRNTALNCSKLLARLDFAFTDIKSALSQVKT